MKPLFRLGASGLLLFATRFLRMFAYGAVAVVLVLYLSIVGVSSFDIGLLLGLTLLGDALLTVVLAANADRKVGRKRTLVAGGLLMAVSGVVFALSTNYWILLAAATLGVISPAGSEIGPFLGVEQAALSQLCADQVRTAVFSWQNLVGVLGQALGAVTGALMVQKMLDDRSDPTFAYRTPFFMYAAVGIALAMFYLGLSRQVEIHASPAAEACRPALDGSRTAGRPSWWSRLYAKVGLSAVSGPIIAKISVLFALDAFAGALVLQSILSYWFYVTYGVSPRTLGLVFFAVNLVAAASSLAAVPLARRYGLVNTMVWTHIPSHVLLILVPLMPSFPLALTMLLLRFSVSQMDVPTRQSYVAAVVDPSERSAAAGINTLARSLGSAFGPLVSGAIMSDNALFSAPFFIAAALKTIYDILLWRSFIGLKAVEERAAPYASLVALDTGVIKEEEVAESAKAEPADAVSLLAADGSPAEEA